MADEQRLKMCVECRALIPVGATQCEMCGAQGHYSGPMMMAEEGALSWASDAPVTALLITVNLLIYAIILFIQTRLVREFFSDEPSLQGFSFSPLSFTNDLFGAVRPSVPKTHEWWRTLTYGFLHGGPLHIGMNCYALLQVGRLAEHIWGSAQYLVLYLLSCIGGGLMVIAWGESAVGASGAIFGLIGALAVYGYRRGGEFGNAIKSYAVQSLVYGLVISFLPGISLAGHLGGALVGAVLALLLTEADVLRQSLSRVRLWQMLAGAGLLAVLVSGALVARNYARGRQVLRVEQSARVVVSALANETKWTRLRAFALMKEAAERDPVRAEQEYGELFRKEYGKALAEVNGKQLKEEIEKAGRAACDALTLAHLPAADQEVGNVQQQLAASIRAMCEPASASATPLTQGHPANAALDQLLQSPTRRAFNTQIAAYWQWLERRAAALQMPVTEWITPAAEKLFRARAAEVNERLPVAQASPAAPANPSAPQAK